jgi:hypothetical protein
MSESMSRDLLDSQILEGALTAIDFAPHTTLFSLRRSGRNAIFGGMLMTEAQS